MCIVQSDCNFKKRLLVLRIEKDLILKFNRLIVLRKVISIDLRMVSF